MGLLGAVSFGASADVTAYAVNGRLSLTGVGVGIDQLVVQQSADGTTDWQTVEGFTKPSAGGEHSDYVYGPDQTLSGVSYWRWSTDAGETWSKVVDVDAGSPVLFGTVIDNMGGAGAQWFDGCWNTFADTWPSGGAWAGLDLNGLIEITRLVILPRYYCSASLAGDIAHVGFGSSIVLDSDAVISGGSFDHSTIAGAEGVPHTLSFSPVIAGTSIDLSFGSDAQKGENNVRFGQGNSDNLTVSLNGKIFAHMACTHDLTTSRLYFSCPTARR